MTGRWPAVLSAWPAWPAWPALLLAPLCLAAAASATGPAVPGPFAVIAAAGPGTAEADLAAALEALRAQGPDAREAAPAIAGLLSQRSDVYRDRGAREVERLRAFLLSTLAEIGPPPEALPAVLAELAHGHRPAVRAAAARAAGALGPEAEAAVPYLIRALEPALHDDRVSLEDYFPQYPPREPTSARIEAVRALVRIGAAARPAVPVLEEIAAAPPGSYYAQVTGLQQEARRALDALAATEGEGHCAHRGDAPRLASDWLPTERRAASPFSSLAATDQEGRRLPLARLQGRPLALAFLYTRCDNPDKCPLTMAKLAGLQAALGEGGLSSRVRLAAVTLDPELDTPGELKRFGEGLGLRPGSEALLLRLPRPDLDRLLTGLQAAVSYGDGRVSLHGIQLYLFDQQGRYVRDYHSVAWDQAEVIADLGRLAAE